MKCPYIALNSFVATRSLPHVVRVCETQDHLMSAAIISIWLLVQGHGKYYDNLHHTVYTI